MKSFIDKSMKTYRIFNEAFQGKYNDLILQSTHKISLTPTTIVITVFVIALTLQTQGYCADGAGSAEMDQMATSVVERVFAPWVRKTALAFGGGWGMIKSISGGSFIPLLTWGGIGLSVNFIPKIIAWF